jgi:hypothetical protein
MRTMRLDVTNSPGTVAGSFCDQSFEAFPKKDACWRALQGIFSGHPSPNIGKHSNTEAIVQANPCYINCATGEQ